MKMPVSIDGFVADARGEKDLLFQTGDEQSLAWSVDQIRQAGLLAIGRKSFETMAPFWPSASGPFAAPMNEIPKAVFTKKGINGKNGGPKLAAKNEAAVGSWTDPLIFGDDLVADISQLKKETGKPIVAIGGAGFMKNLIASGLVDEYHIAVHPVVLGSSQPIFTGLKLPLYLKLIETHVFPIGIVAHSFQNLK